jgi:uncharacterized protein
MDDVELFQAAGTNNAAALRSLLQLGRDPNCVAEQYGHTPLYNACFSDSAETVRVLLEYGADPNKRFTYRSPVDGRVEVDLVALMFARSMNVATLLLDVGADVNISAANGTTALMRAAFRGNPEVVQLLLGSGANASARNAAGNSALDLVSGKLNLFFPDASSRLKEGHAQKRLSQFTDVCELLSKAVAADQGA